MLYVRACYIMVFFSFWIRAYYYVQRAWHAHIQGDRVIVTDGRI